MFDISLGIDSEISGYINIVSAGLVLGLSSSEEIEARMADIVEFTELGDYLDIPVRTYSSGDDTPDVCCRDMFCARDIADGRMDHGEEMRHFWQGAETH